MTEEPALAELRRRERKIEERNRARCHRYGALYVEPVLLSVVFDRDGGRCWLCGGQALLIRPVGAIIVDRAGLPRSLWHPELATLDHVVPLADRGEHSYANVRLAHQVCNARTDRPAPEVLRRLVDGVRASWEANAATAARLTEIGYAAASLRRNGIGSSRVHLVTLAEAVWVLACAPGRSYPLDQMERTVAAPTCRSCRGRLRRLLMAQRTAHPRPLP